MFNLRGSSNRSTYLMGLVFLLLIFALGTTAFRPMPPEVAHAGGGILGSGPAVSATFPGAFSKSKPANAATNQPTNPTLKWGTSNYATYYEYCIDTDNDNACNAYWSSVGKNTSIALSALNPGVTYYWQVRATNATGTTYANGSGTAWWSFSIVTIPVNFTKSGPADGTSNLPSNPKLSWNPSSNAASYTYCIDTSNNNKCNTSWISTGTRTSIRLSSLNPGTTYYWQVRATNAAGTTYANSSSPAWWSFKVASLPGPFGKTKPTNGVTNQPLDLTLSWKTSKNATDYQYCIDTINDYSCNKSWISTGRATSIALSSLKPATTYYWQVRASNAAGTTQANNGNSGWWYFTTSQLPGDFKKSSPATGAANQHDNVTLSWKASSNATDYQYCIDTSGNNTCNGSWISTGTATSVVMSFLKPDTTYFWQVRARNDGHVTYANGSTNAWWYFTVSPLPGSFSKTSPGNGEVDLSKAIAPTSGNLSQTGHSIGATLKWMASKAANSYEYCIDGTNDNTCNASWIPVGNNTSVDLNGLSLGSHYYWQVRAKNASGLTYANGYKTAWWSFSISNTGQ